MQDLLTITAVLIGGILLYRYHRAILNALGRFDARNIERRKQEIRDRYDPLAHFRHTFGVAEEQVEEISEVAMSDDRTGQPVTRYVFEGEMFATRGEAEKARAQSIGQKARGFYAELPTALRARRGDDKLN
ncbi:MAG TPA: hypothetical protein VH000_01740 [Rhizomicrobium sp.]|jgi:hypothetical protein|nr:hypothetical protein [Rhizomicrobium sp.]HEX4532926.1 hypothetical protein [Rhizomicrobium sp.]